MSQTAKSETPTEIAQDELPDDIQKAVDGFTKAQDEGHKYAVFCRKVNARVLEDYELRGFACSSSRDTPQAFFWPV
jgi:hypothetical protein